VSIAMAKTLFILNEQPYGGERSYNGLRMALALLKPQGKTITF
jgi:sulfur relay (sulfurtransferase) DsrF/TusC family protein